jgi:hypothetical protein
VKSEGVSKSFQISRLERELQMLQLTALCHQMQLCRHFVNQTTEFCLHNPLKGRATSNTKGKRIFRYGLSPEIFEYNLVCSKWCIEHKLCHRTTFCE